MDVAAPALRGGGFSACCWRSPAVARSGPRRGRTNRRAYSPGGNAGAADAGWRPASRGSRGVGCPSSGRAACAATRLRRCSRPCPIVWLVILGVVLETPCHRLGGPGRGFVSDRGTMCSMLKGRAVRLRLVGQAARLGPARSRALALTDLGLASLRTAESRRLQCGLVWPRFQILCGFSQFVLRFGQIRGDLHNMFGRCGQNWGALTSSWGGFGKHLRNPAWYRSPRRHVNKPGQRPTSQRNHVGLIDHCAWHDFFVPIGSGIGFGAIQVDAF